MNSQCGKNSASVLTQKATTTTAAANELSANEQSAHKAVLAALLPNDE